MNAKQTCGAERQQQQQQEDGGIRASEVVNTRDDYDDDDDPAALSLSFPPCLSLHVSPSLIPSLRHAHTQTDTRRLFAKTPTDRSRQKAWTASMERAPTATAAAVADDNDVRR